MDKGKACKSCCELKEGIHEMGRCETCQAKIQEEKLSKMTGEENDEYDKVKRLKTWNKVRL